MKRLFLFLGIIIFTTQIYGHEYRNLLQNEGSKNDLGSILLENNEWIKYPAYSNRVGWDKLTANHKQEIIERGEKALDYKWQVITAGEYLEFEKSGSRTIMQKPYGENSTALVSLIMAELAEGNGRFLQKIADGVWYFCEMTSWTLSAHVSRAQKERTSLPSFRENIIDLGSGNMGSLLAWTYYFFHKEFDKIQPLISQRLYSNIDERIIKPYMQRSNFWWQNFYALPNTMVNNWCPWCNFNVLTCMVLIKDDKQELTEGVYRTMVSVDKFINYTKSDGACEEGPSYWGHAAGKMFDYLDLLYKITGGHISIFDNPLIKKMGEYIVNSYVGDDWVVNFADASARASGAKAGVIYRYGKAVGSENMQHFAALLNKRNGGNNYNSGTDISNTLENLSTDKEIELTDTTVTSENFIWYPKTEFCFMKNQKGFFVAAKGGYNDESHNHNDMGTFSLYVDNKPMIIDVGVGTYTRQTFSSERYSIWTMQSNYHNLPIINGVPESNGFKYRSKNVSVNARNLTFTVDLCDAYPKESKINSWKRSYHLFSTDKLIIEDKYNLSEIKGDNQLNFMTWGKPDTSRKGIVSIEKNGKKIELKYNSNKFTSEVNAIDLKDPRLSSVWGEKIYRLSLNAINRKLSDSYKITIER